MVDSQSLRNSAADDIRRIVLLGYANHPHVSSAMEQTRKLLHGCAEIVGDDIHFQLDLATLQPDLVIVFGGDGSILRAAHLMGMHQAPVLGVNLGKLGFLAAVSPNELSDVLPRVLRGDCPVVEHLMLSCQLIRNGKTIQQALGLNEVTIHSGEPFRILDVHLYVDSELVTTYSSDGVIISTPVGSTAYNLSVGGPILRKDLQAFVISPISPHTLTNRPVVDSADRSYEMVVERPNPGTTLVVDGKALARLRPGDRVRVTRSEACFRMLEVQEHGYYCTLRDKLGWGGRLKHNKNK